ncbi:hypothetical protein DUD79_28760 [Priestia aryabhattai]
MSETPSSTLHIRQMSLQRSLHFEMFFEKIRQNKLIFFYTLMVKTAIYFCLQLNRFMSVFFL